METRFPGAKAASIGVHPLAGQKYNAADLSGKGVVMSSSRRRPVYLALFALLVSGMAGCAPSNAWAPPGTGDGYLFCFWNVENLFDDRDNGHTGADREYDRWFARDPAALQLKLDHLSAALIGLNGGRGPDILAVAEVESLRAAELLRDALNRRLADESLHYQHLLMKE